MIGGQLLLEPELVVTFLLHAPVLEPDFDGALGQSQLRGQLAAARPRDIVFDLKLFLQLVELLASERGSISSDVVLFGCFGALYLLTLVAVKVPMLII